MQQQWQVGVIALAALALLAGCTTVDTLDPDAPQNKEYIAVPPAMPAIAAADTPVMDHPRI